MTETRNINPSAWSFTEQEAFADRVLADFDSYTYTDVCIAGVIRRQQRERQQRLRSRQLWLAYFRRVNPRFADAPTGPIITTTPIT